MVSYYIIRFIEIFQTIHYSLHYVFFEFIIELIIKKSKKFHQAIQFICDQSGFFLFLELIVRFRYNMKKVRHLHN